MIRIEIAALVERLHPLVRRALEQAAAVSVNQHATEISVIHLLNELIDTPLCDIRFIFHEYGIEAERAKSLLQVSPLDRTDYPQSYPSFSPLLVEWLQDSWLLASTELNQHELRSGALFLVLLTHRHRYLPVDFCRLIEGIHREQLTAKINSITRDSAENCTTDVSPSRTIPANFGGEGSLLSRFTTDITEAARENRLDPVLCRDEEIDLMIDILCRRRKNNPIVVGEAGVGKSALIEGLASRIVANQVPDPLKGTVLLSLDLGAMQAGASVKGEFEKRFKGIMQEIFDAPAPVILFIDEAHTLIGAGNTQGGLDVSNLLKPALARGELKTIAATTWREYKKYIEKDAALTRRFQLVKVNEPDLVQATTILPLWVIVDNALDASVQGMADALEVANYSLFRADEQALAVKGPWLLAAWTRPRLVQYILSRPEYGFNALWLVADVEDPEQLIRHLQGLLYIKEEGGASNRFRFYDPRVFNHWLHNLAAIRLDDFFGPVQMWISPDPNPLMTAQRAFQYKLLDGHLNCCELALQRCLNDEQ